MGSHHYSFKVFEGEPEKQMLDVRSQTWVRRLPQSTWYQKSNIYVFVNSKRGKFKGSECGPDFSL